MCFMTELGPQDAENTLKQVDGFFPSPVCLKDLAEPWLSISAFVIGIGTLSINAPDAEETADTPCGRRGYIYPIITWICTSAPCGDVHLWTVGGVS